MRDFKCTVDALKVGQRHLSFYELTLAKDYLISAEVNTENVPSEVDLLVWQIMLFKVHIR